MHAILRKSFVTLVLVCAGAVLLPTLSPNSHAASRHLRVYGADIALLPLHEANLRHPYNDSKGISVAILHASAHRITGDDGCFRPTPQYHADFVASFFNFTARPQKIGLVGFNLADDAGSILRPSNLPPDPNIETTVAPHTTYRRHFSFELTDPNIHVLRATWTAHEPWSPLSPAILGLYQFHHTGIQPCS